MWTSALAVRPSRVPTVLNSDTPALAVFHRYEAAASGVSVIVFGAVRASVLLFDLRPKGEAKTRRGRHESGQRDYSKEELTSHISHSVRPFRVANLSTLSTQAIALRPCVRPALESRERY